MFKLWQKTSKGARNYETAFVVVVLLLVFASIAASYNLNQATAAFPKYINFQGKLTKVSDGTNVANGTYAVRFKIYDALTSGSLLWTETYDQSPVNVCQKIQVTNGVFNAKLGSCNPLTIDVTAGDLYLSVDFAPTGTSYDGEMSPRKQLVASAFAFNANNVVGDGRIDIAYAPGTSTNSGGKIDFSPSVSSAKSSLELLSGSNVTGAALKVTQAGTGLGIDLAGAGSLSRTINSTSADLAFKTTTSGNITATTATTSGIFNILTGSLKVGAGTPDVTLNGDDAYVSGTLEVDGAARFDALVTGNLGATISGATISLNDASNFAVNIGTGTSTGTVTLGGSGTQTISVGNGAGVKTVNLGSSNSSSITTILSGSGGLLLNKDNNQPTNINTGTSSGLVTIGGGSGTFSLQTTDIDISGGAITNATGITTATGNVAITAGALTLGGTTRISNAGVATFITGSVLGSQTFTTNNILDSGALTIGSTSGNITLQSSGSGTTGNVYIGETSATPDLLVVGIKNTAGNPTAVEGSVYYNSNTGKFYVSEGSSPAWKEVCNKTDAACGAGSGSAWSALSNALGNLSLSNAEYTSSILWDTASTAAAKDYLTLSVTNDASTDSNTQRVLVVQNNDDGGSTGTTERLVVIDNADTNEAVTTALEIGSTGGGAVTTAIDVSDSDIGTALNFGANDIVGTTGNIDLTNFDVVGSSGAVTAGGLITGTAGLTISGAATSINASSNFATNINTGTSNTLVSIGGGSGTFALDTTNIDISNTGAITNATGFNGLVVTANTGVVTTGTWQGTAVADTYVADTLTLGSSSSVHWDALNNYPAACSAGSAISALADTTNTCTAFNTDTSITLQDAYGQGATISTSGSDIGFTLNSSQKFTVATAASGTGASEFTLTDGSNASPPAQLILIRNNDTTEALASGLKVTSAAGTITTGIDLTDTNIGDALNVGANNITGAGYTVTSTASGLTLNSTSANLALQTTTSGNITLAPASTGAVQITSGVTTGAGTSSALSLVANSLSSGNGLAVSSNAAASFSGNLVDIALSDGTGASSNTGSLLMLTNSGTANANTALYVKHYATGTNNLALRVDDVSSDSTPFVIDGAGQVGIGTSSPQAALSVAGNAIFGAGDVGTPTATTIRGAAASGSNIAGTNLTFDASNGTGTGGSGAFIFRTASPIASGSSADTLTERLKISSLGNIDINGAKDGSLQAFATNGNNLPTTLRDGSSVVANGYIYYIGGADGSTPIVATVYYAKLNADGSTGAWQTNTNSLPAARFEGGVVVVRGYIYYIGGLNNVASATNTVYYAKLNSDGSTGVWQTNSNNIVSAVGDQGVITANGYIYTLGGTISSSPSTAVYYAKVNADGSTGVWQTNGNSLPAARTRLSAVVANGYAYAIGGGSVLTAASNTVYYGKLNADGTISAFSTNSNNLPANRWFATSAVSNGYLYVIGGSTTHIDNGTNTIYYGFLNSDGSVSAFSTNINTLTASLRHLTSSVANGYIYTLGGLDTAPVEINKVYYASTNRLRIGSNVDLLGLSGQVMGDSTGDSASTLFAGNVQVTNNLEVSNNAQFWEGVSVNGTFNLQGTAGVSGGTGIAAPLALSITGGAGGNSSTGSTAGAAGGAIIITSGAGGNSTGVTGANGANITLQGGAGGTGSVSGSYGNIILNSAGGNVGIGDATPAALLTVGSGDLFQVGTDGNVTIATTASTTAITITDTDYTNALSVGDNNITGAGYTITSTASGLTLNSTSADLTLQTTTSGDILVKPASFIAKVGGGTSVTELRFLEPSGTGTDYAGFKSNANVTTSYVWTFPAADASGCIQSNGSGVLSINACGGGSLTPWTSDIDADNFSLLDFGPNLTARAGTTITATSGNLALATATSGNITLAPASTGSVQVTSGVTTGTTTSSAMSLAANSVNSGTGLNISATSLTTGNAQNITLGSALTTGGALNITGASYNHTGSETGTVAGVAFTDGTTNAVTSTTNGILISPTISAGSGAATRTIQGLSITPTFTACSAGTCAVNALNVGNVTDGTGFTGTGIAIGTGWDSGFAIQSGGNSITAQSVTALTVGRTGATYALQVDTNTANSVTGLKVTSAASAGGLDLAVISSGTNENLRINAKGSGTVGINNTATGDVFLTGGGGSVSIGSGLASAGKLGIDNIGSSDNVIALSLSEGANNEEFSIRGMFGSTGSNGNAIKFYSGAFSTDNILYMRGDGRIGIGVNVGTTVTSKPALDIDLPDQTTLSTEEIVFRSNATTQALASAATVANMRANQFFAPTLNGVAGGGTETVTNAATVYIDAAPSGSNITITNAYGLWVDSGTARFDGDVTVAGLLTGTLGATISGATISLNDSSNFAVNIGTGSSTGTITLGGSGTQTIAIGDGAGIKTVSLGSSNTSSATTIQSGSGNLTLNKNSGNLIFSSFNCTGNTNGGALTADGSGIISCSNDDGGGGSSTLQGDYDATSGNTILTTTARNIAITLGEVVTPTSLTVENQDTAGVSAQRIFNSIASGTLTNGLLIEQTGAGTMTNGIQIAETAGTITDGILITGTLGNILNSPTLDITGAGGITGSTGYVQGSGTMSLTSANTTQTTTSSIFALNGNSLSSGTGFYGASSTLTSGKLIDLQVSGTVAAASQTALNILTAGANGTDAITTYGAQISNTHTTSASTNTNVALYLNASGGTTNYGLIVNAGNVGIGTTAPANPLSVIGSAVGIAKFQSTAANPNVVIRRDDTSGVSHAAYINYGTVNQGDLWFAGVDIAASGSFDYQIGDSGSTTYIDVSGANGNVGISQTTPIGVLDVNNSTTRAISADANARTLNIQGAFTEAGSGTHARIMGVEITPPTITAGAASVTNTASLYISDAPTASGATNYALWVDAGTARFDGDVTISGTCTGCGGASSLQGAYNGGNTISTSGSPIALTLNSADKFTVATAASGTGASEFTLTDGSNATPPGQLVLIRNNDTNQALASGLKVTSAAGTVTTGVDLTDTNIGDALSVGANNITGAGYTITSTASGLTVNSTSANLALSTTTSGNITATTGAAAGLFNVLTGNLQVGNGSPNVSLNGEDAYIEGTFEVDGTSDFAGLITASAGLTLTGTTQINATGSGTTTIGSASAGAISLQSTSTINLTAGAASTFSAVANTANAYRITDGTTAYIAVDTRTGTSAVSGLTFTASAPSFAAATSAEFTTATFTPPTLTLTGSTAVTTQMDSILFNQPTITDASAVAVTSAANVTIAGAVISHASGSVTLANSYGLKINTAGVDGGTGVVTNAYSLYLDAPTGAANNYAAVFATGNVGIGQTAPSQKLTVSDGIILNNFGSDSTPTVLGGIDLSIGVNAVTVSGKYAYLGLASATGNDFRIYDIHNKSSPLSVGGIDTSSDVFAVAVAGKYAFIGRSADAGTCSGTTVTGCELRIYDISNPNAPSAVGGIDTAIAVNSIVVQGKYLYLGLATAAGNDFRIYDITNPTVPASIGGVDAGTGVKSIAVQGKYAYLGLNTIAGTCSGTTLTGCELSLYDISNPATPAAVNGIDITTDVLSIQVSANLILVGLTSASGNDFRIYDAVVPGTISLDGGIDLSTGVNSIHVNGKYAYLGLVSDGSTGKDVRIINIADPTAPSSIGGVDVSIGVNGVFASGKYLFTALASVSGNDFRIYDISGLDAPSATIGSVGAGTLSVTEDARFDSSMYVGGSATIGGGLSVNGQISNNYTLTTASSGFTFGSRSIYNISSSSVAATHTGQFIRVLDDTSLTGASHIVRGLEVQAYSGSNNNGVNTGIISYGKTFGIYGVSTGQAAAVSQPAAVFADLDNGSATTAGNAIRAYTNDATSADLISLYQETSAFTGAGIVMDFGNSGSYSGNFLNLKEAGTSRFTFADTGRMDILTPDADNAISFYLNTEESTVTQSVFAIESDTTGNGQSADTVKAHFEADGSLFISLPGTANTTALCHASAGLANNDEIVDCSGAPSDVAEFFGSRDASLAPAEVVVSGEEATTMHLDGYHTSKAWVARSSKPYDNLLLGVVSTSPAQAYGDEIFDATENPKPIALVGRVPVKVVIEGGVIKPGDYLTSSSTPGAAMKATKPGMVIGQALSSYNGTGEAVVLVFVNPFYNDPTTFLDSDGNIQIQNGSSSQIFTANTQNTASLVVNQKGSGDILQLQQNGADRFLVQNNGSLQISTIAANEIDSLVVVKNGNNEVFNINARGDVSVKGILVVKDDNFAGSIQTLEDGLAEITFTYDLGTGKPVMQLTVEGENPIFAQIKEWKKDDLNRYTGVVIKTFAPSGEAVPAIVHFFIVAKQADYETFGLNLDVLTYPSGSNQTITSGDGSGDTTPPDGTVAGDSTGTPSDGSGDTTPPAGPSTPPPAPPTTPPIIVTP